MCPFMVSSHFGFVVNVVVVKRIFLLSCSYSRAQRVQLNKTQLLFEMSLVKTKHSEIFKQTSDELTVIGTSVLNIKCITLVGFVSLQPNILK